MEPVSQVLQATVGQLLVRAREAAGLSLAALAQELKLPQRHLEAIEADDWEALPPGRPRPLARQLAQRLGVDLEFHTDAFQTVPGVPELEAPSPRQEQLERIVMGLLTVASVLLVLWLVVPGPRLGRKPEPRLQGLQKASLPPPPAPSTGLYPVLGELLPEAPLNEQGILVSLRAMDGCVVRLEPLPGSEGQSQARTLQVSEPWRLRMKGPFSLQLENAGVVKLEVAGVSIRHGSSVGETWVGRFDERGRWLKPIIPDLPEDPALSQDDEEDQP